MKFAIKRLTRSDLTFFESKFRTIRAGNQKAINLNRDVFEKALFPAAAVAAQDVDFKLPVTVDIFGPDGAPQYRLARHITKGTTYKNWRLNGAFVPDPDDQPQRFDGMAEGDIAVLGFEGEPVPSRVALILVTPSGADASLHAKLLEEVGGSTARRAMLVVSTERLPRNRKPTSELSRGRFERLPC